MIEKSSRKHEKMKVSNLGNHGFSEGKTHISLKSRFTNYIEKAIEKIMKTHGESMKHPAKNMFETTIFQMIKNIIIVVPKMELKSILNHLIIYPQIEVRKRMIQNH